MTLLEIGTVSKDRNLVKISPTAGGKNPQKRGGGRGTRAKVHFPCDSVSVDDWGGDTTIIGN